MTSDLACHSSIGCSLADHADGIRASLARSVSQRGVGKQHSTPQREEAP